MILIASCEWVSYAVLGKGSTAGIIVGTVIPLLLVIMAFREDTMNFFVIDYAFDHSGWTTEQKLRIMKVAGATNEQIAEAAKAYAAGAEAANQTPAPLVVDAV